MKRVELEVLRIRLGLTKEEMAEKCGINRNTYASIERGISSGSDKFWLNVMKLGNLTPDELFKIQYENHLSKQE